MWFSRQLNIDTSYKRHENLTTDIICTALLGFHAISGCNETGKFPGYSKKFVLECLCDSNKWSIAGVNQSGSIRHAFRSRWEIIRAFFRTVILQTQDLSKHPPSGSFKMAHVSQTAVGFTEIITKKFFEYITPFVSANILSSFAIVARSRRLWLEVG